MREEKERREKEGVREEGGRCRELGEGKKKIKKGSESHY